MNARPDALEAECALLGAMLINNEAYFQVAPLVRPEHFCENLHGRMFEVMASLIQANRSASPVTIKGYFGDEKVGDDPVHTYAARLAADAPTTINAQDYARAIRDTWAIRCLMADLEGAMSHLGSLKPGQHLESVLSDLQDNLLQLSVKLDEKETAEGMGAAFMRRLTLDLKRGHVRGVPIALKEIADVISEPCFEAGNLYGLLSSSGEGKTSLTIQLLSHAFENGHPTLFFSYDQSADQIIRQMAAQKRGIEARRIRNPKLLGNPELEDLNTLAGDIDRFPFRIIKCADQSAGHLVNMARAFVRKHGTEKVPFIVVDHIGSVKPEDRKADEGTKAKEINKILKAGAEVTDAAWLVLNQRNSFGMRRDNPRPVSSDLFGGDPAKQAYDAIAYLYRPEKFREERQRTATTKMDYSKIESAFGKYTADHAEIGAIKVRFGPTNIRKDLVFEDRFTRYRSIITAEQAELIEGGW
ncbi:MAG: replicative DNA helicase [Flavobacteriaceae bacterium]